MSAVALEVPQLGEGLREVRLIRQLKPVGATVRLDEPLYEVETEKAALEIESSCAGTVLAWRYAEGDTVPVHAAIVDIEPAAAAPVIAPRIAPRARAWARDHGIADDALTAAARALGGRALQPEDLAGEAPDGTDEPLSPRQRTLNQRAFGDPTSPVPATLTRPIPYALVASALARSAAECPDLLLSDFQIVVWAIAQASVHHPKLRSRLQSRETLRRFDHVDLGFAVRLPGDELATAVIRRADTLDLPALSSAISGGMKAAVRGKEEPPDHRTTLIVSSLAAYGVTEATPVLTPPATAIVFVGAPYPTPEGARVNLTMTFDHRVLNGVGAAQFLVTVEEEIRSRASPRPEVSG